MASGSDKRQRTKQCLVRLTSEEHAEIVRKADKAGIATAAFLRATALGDAGPRAKRRPPADYQTLRRVLGELGRIGNNLNQIAHRLNMNQSIHLPELRDALKAYLAIRNAIFEALGMALTEEDRPARKRKPSHGPERP